MATAQDIIFRSLCLLGIYAPNETMDASDSSLGLSVLNSMMDSWSNESLFCYAIQEYSFPLVVGQQQYTIGPGGDVNTNRPIKILDGPGVCYIQDGNQNNYPVYVVPQDRWNQIGLRTTTSNLPDTLFYDPQYPLGIINIFPVPLDSYTVFFDANITLSEFSNLIQSLALPPGYEAAIIHNLAIWMKPYFKDAQIDPIIIELASQTKAAVKRSNLRSNVAVYEQEIVSHSASTYNVYSDRSGTA